MRQRQIYTKSYPSHTALKAGKPSSTRSSCSLRSSTYKVPKSNNTPMQRLTVEFVMCSTLYLVQYDVFSVQRAVCSVRCAVCSVQCAVCSVQRAACNMQHSVCSVQCAVWSAMRCVKCEGERAVCGVGSISHFLPRMETRGRTHQQMGSAQHCTASNCNTATAAPVFRVELR